MSEVAKINVSLILIRLEPRYLPRTLAQDTLSASPDLERLQGLGSRHSRWMLSSSWCCWAGCSCRSTWRPGCSRCRSISGQGLEARGSGCSSQSLRSSSMSSPRSRPTFTPGPCSSSWPWGLLGTLVRKLEIRTQINNSALFYLFQDCICQF